MDNEELDMLVSIGSLLGYKYSTVEFEPGSGNRATEQLVLLFPNGSALKLDTFCSGSSQNTVLVVKSTNAILQGFDE